MRRSGTTSPARRASGVHCAKCWSNDMPERVVKLPDIGEGVAEAELVEWHVKGSGPAGRVTHEDLDAFLSQPPDNRNGRIRANTEVTEIKIAGLRRAIAGKISLASTRIPHFTYVEELDVTALEELRATLNKDAP